MAKWIASLSDGRTIEEKDLFVEGEDSPYRKLLKIIEKDKVSITGFRIQVKGRTYVAPSNSKLAKFPSVIKTDVQMRKRATLTQGGVCDKFYGFFFVIGDKRIYQRISEETGDSWIQILDDGKLSKNKT